ncbi:CLUMA_CG001005, isoform A [Clunio marinus]|uniref:CLUMA_CG001005, isoform A n=1 Tax=Clunio marinus TaxID=568069 RepID=A0A1J1HLU6_9DIPT|nr:CLUMA_CG001005, isoform A [Clunio marinus]
MSTKSISHLVTTKRIRSLSFVPRPAIAL